MTVDVVTEPRDVERRLRRRRPGAANDTGLMDGRCRFGCGNGRLTHEAAGRRKRKQIGAHWHGTRDATRICRLCGCFHRPERIEAAAAGGHRRRRAARSQRRCSRRRVREYGAYIRVSTVDDTLCKLRRWGRGCRRRCIDEALSARSRLWQRARHRSRLPAERWPLGWSHVCRWSPLPPRRRSLARNPMQRRGIRGSPPWFSGEQPGCGRAAIDG